MRFPVLVRFIWADVNTEIELGCGSKQLDQDLLKEVVSVRLQTGAVCLWYEGNLTSNPTLSAASIAYCWTKPALVACSAVH